jgi:Redoxin.
MKISSFIFLFYFIGSICHAQTLRDVIQHIKRVKNLSYSELRIEKDIFSDSLYRDTINAQFKYTNKDTIIKIHNGESEVWRDSQKLIALNHADSSYKIQAPNVFSGLIYNSLPHILMGLERELPSNKKILPLKDSVFQGVLCDYYRFTAVDSVKNGKRVYDTKYFLVNKKTQLPIYYQWDSQGFLGDNITHVTVFQESVFKDTKINVKQFSDIGNIEIPSNYSPFAPKEVKPLLKSGVQSPSLAFLGANNKVKDIRDLKGKIVLLNISLVGCPHCILSIPWLNRLKEKYGQSGLEIVSLYPLDNDGNVTKMNTRFGVKYSYNGVAPRLKI